MSADAEPFQLIETMRWEPHARIPLLDGHLGRLSRSAAAFDFAFDAVRIRSALDSALAAPPHTAARVRLLLHADGHSDVTVAPLGPEPAERLVFLARQPIDSRIPWQYHKTTRREQYERGFAAASARGAYDLVYLNERGEVAEASRHNLFLEQDGVLYTPPVNAGVLPGVQREAILTDSARCVVERTLRLDDLTHAAAVFLSNAVRGLVQVRFDAGAPPVDI